MERIKQTAKRLNETGADLAVRAARVCYKSTSEGKDNEKFLQSLVQKRHLSPFEFWRTIDPWYMGLPKERHARYLLERGKTLDEIKAYNIDYEWIALEITTNIGIARELMRHRVFSYCQESTRYCNYQRKGIAFIPFTKEGVAETALLQARSGFYDFYSIIETHYNRLIDSGIPVEEIRGILPLDTATTLVMGGFDYQWERLLESRLHEKSGKVHPQMKELAQLIEKEVYETRSN